MTFQPQYIYYSVGFFGGLVTFWRWAIKVSRRKSIEHVFIRDMAKNHLPHIYTALTLIGDKLNVPIAESPHIKFLDEQDFEGK